MFCLPLRSRLKGLKRSVHIATLVMGCLLAVGHSHPVAAGVLPAREADKFVDSIGVATHLAYTNTPYFSQWNTVKDRLGASGIRHIRDGIYGNPTAAARFNELAASHGIKSTQVVDRRVNNSLDPSLIPSSLSYIKDNLGASCEAIEGPNEYDINHPDSETAGNLWLSKLKDFQLALYTQANADGALANLPILAPSMGRTSNINIQSVMMDRVDAGNAHPYTNGLMPSSRSPFDTYTRYAQDVYAGKPLYVTESGYHNAVNWTGDLRGVSEAAAAKYLPRMFLHYFRRGITRTFSYEFIDQFPDAEDNDRESNFGLLRHDLSEKPAYVAIKNLQTLLADPGSAFAPGYLNYSLSGRERGALGAGDRVRRLDIFGLVVK